MEEIFNEVKVNEYKIGSLWRSFYSSIVALLLSSVLVCTFARKGFQTERCLYENGTIKKNLLL